ncbi:MAG: hypothetical protein ACUZ77_03195 [Candidatus Brocadiales bacterium]
MELLPIEKTKQDIEDIGIEYETKHVTYDTYKIVIAIHMLAEVLYEQTSEINRQLGVIASNLAETRSGQKQSSTTCIP